MTPIGYSARIPPPGTGNSLADINSDIAFKGNLAFQGHWSGFRVIDISDPANPTQIYNTEACRHTSGQGDVVVHGNILVRTWDSASNDLAEREPDVHGPRDRPGLRGHPHLGHLEPRRAGVQEAAPHVRDRQRRRRPGGGLRRAHGDRRAG